ncbi:MAG: hypothetical protein QM736_22965 [Vicinamibacterales bacterium]
MSSPRRALVVLLIVALLAGVAWYLTHRVDRTPVAVAPAAHDRWTMVTSDGTDPWVVGMKPPESLTTSLFEQVSARAGTALVAPPHPAIPLVLRSEFDEALQGAFGVDSIQRMAIDAGLDADVPFEPVCLAHKTVDGVDGPAELYFVPFVSAGFNQLRVNLMPEHPEQAGIGIYDPSILTPILVVAASDSSFDRWWPLRFDQDRDCEAPVALR